MINPERIPGVWHPISEAPKDGTEILGYSRKYDVPWFVIHWAFYVGFIDNKNGYWVFSDDGCEAYHEFPEDVTHFQYLTIPKEFEAKP